MSSIVTETGKALAPAAIEAAKEVGIVATHAALAVGGTIATYVAFLQAGPRIATAITDMQLGAALRREANERRKMLAFIQSEAKAQA